MSERPSPGAPPGHGGSASIANPDYWWYRVRSRLLQVVLEQYVAAPERLLDVGSADGPSAGWLREVGTPERPLLHVSLDLDPRGLPSGGVCGSVTGMPFADGVFDVVTAFDVVEHCVDEARALSELKRVLRPGGRLLMSVPAYQWAWTGFDVENGHHRRYTRHRARAAVQAAGLHVDRVTYAFAAVFPAFAGARLARRVRERVSGRGAEQAVDVVAVPEVSPLVDRVLSAASRIDERVLAHANLPFGSSVFLAATKPG